MYRGIIKNFNHPFCWVSIVLVGYILFFTNDPITDQGTQIKYIKGKDSIVYKIDTVRETITKWIPSKTIRDTIKIIVNSENVVDTVNCWELSQAMPDSAIIGVSLCSDSLKIKPSDLTAQIRYTVPPFQKTKLVYRVDVKEVPIVESKARKIFRGVLIGICSGAVGYVACEISSK